WAFPATMPVAFCRITWTRKRPVFSARSWGIEQGRKTRPRLKVGLCGEHGGDADSVKFCHTLGMDCISASPFPVPIARLAAAQVMVEVKQTKQKTREMTEKSDLK